jgi:acyl-CoA thioester hydrolase
MHNQSHNFPIRIYYEDTDAGGVVYHASYLNFCERARTELLRDVGFNQSSIVEKTGHLFVVRSAALDYRKPAVLDDSLNIATKINKIGNASIEFQQDIVRGDSVLVQVTITIVCVNEKMRPTRVPDDIRQALSQYLTQK